MNKVKFEFEELPEANSYRAYKETGKYHELTEVLKSNPGKWVKLEGRRSGSMASAIQRGVLKDFNPPGAYEAKNRNFDRASQKCDLYVRYVGSGQ